jgi:hypothetical protein
MKKRHGFSWPFAELDRQTVFRQIACLFSSIEARRECVVARICGLHGAACRP